MRNLLHEWHMNRKIKAILAYNKAHPEECFDLSKFIAKEGIQLNKMTTEGFFVAFHEMKAAYGGGENHV